jgi:hypothetical protein
VRDRDSHLEILPKIKILSSCNEIRISGRVAGLQEIVDWSILDHHWNGGPSGSNWLSLRLNFWRGFVGVSSISGR